MAESNRPIEVRPVADRRQRAAFIDLPWKLYADDPLWVPPMRFTQVKLFDPRPGRSAFAEHGMILPALAWRDGRIVGRIAVIRNDLHNRHHEDRTGFWGFFESIDDIEVARALIDFAAEQLTAMGMDRMVGPMNPSINSECGLLVEGFDSPPAFLMPYNPDYYPKFMDALGMVKEQDLLAMTAQDRDMDISHEHFDKLQRVSQRIFDRHPGLVIRSLDKADFKRQIIQLNHLFNDARKDNWGFVPVTDREFDELVAEFRFFADPEFIAMAEYKGEVVGCMLAIPDLNPAFKKCNGRLFPFGWWHLLMARRRRGAARIFGAAVREDCRHMGIAPALFNFMALQNARLKYAPVELSWIAESNLKSLQSIRHMIKIEPSKRYRVYRKPLG
ncbi:MAG: hypothetical protein JJU36_04540 [Phycisphaeraceae bacterium]|nr:hypothetical protein [Phycisphaeraceae bacterium]